MLAKILAVRHGFTCTVLFPINPADGTIDPVTLTNIPGMAALDSADLCLMSLRFRELPDAQMKHFVDYLNRGKPIIALRTSTHAFAYEHNKQSPYAKFDWRNKDWPGGFGQQVLGETWVDHHGAHGKESTRGLINARYKNRPILRGVSNIWVPTDVYTVTHLQSDASILVWGEVLSGMNPTDPPVEGVKNNPLMPVVWLRVYHGSKIFTTTMGAAVDPAERGPPPPHRQRGIRRYRVGRQNSPQSQCRLCRRIQTALVRLRQVRPGRQTRRPGAQARLRPGGCRRLPGQ